MADVKEDPVEHNERSEDAEHSEKRKVRAVEELLKQRTDSEITIEATVDTGFEFMAIEECRDKFGKDFPVLKERGSIFFNIEKSKYPEVKQMRSVDNLYLVLSYDPNMGLKGTNTAEDVTIAKKQANTPEWDYWLDVWKDLSGFEGIVKPTIDQYTAANERATKDKEAEKLRQAERQLKIKERQKLNSDRKARRKARFDLIRSQQAAASKVDLESQQSDAAVENEPSTGGGETVLKVTEEPKEGKDDLSEEELEPDSTKCPVDDSTETEVPAVIVTKDSSEGVGDGVDSDDEIQSLPDYEKDIDKEIDASVPPGERVLRFRATCFRVGKHSFGSMEVAREFGGELQDKFHWVVDLVNFNVEVILFLLKDTAQVSLALTRKSLHRRNIYFFGPTTLRSTVCHNLIRLADIKPGDIVLDPLAGGGSVPIEGAMSFPGTCHLGGDNHIKAVSRFYSNKRALQEEIGKGIPIDALRWDARRLPLNEACVDVIVSDLPFGIRQGNKQNNRSLYRRVLLEMARVARPSTGRAILLTQDRKSFSLALVNTMGLWWQSRVMSVNIGGLDAAVFTLRRTAKVRPDEADLAAAAEKAKQAAAWRDSSGYSSGNRGGQGYGYGGFGRGRGRGGGGGRGRPYPRGNRGGGNRGGGGGGNWRDNGRSNPRS